MADIIGSATRYRQSDETIRKMTERAFGKAEDFSVRYILLRRTEKNTC